jgi:Flp pilus assembly CpaE family ATPase
VKLEKRLIEELQGRSQIFHATTGGARALSKELGIPFLGAVPLDPRIGVACDYGESFFDAYPESPACDGLLDIIRALRDEMGLLPLTDYSE